MRKCWPPVSISSFAPGSYLRQGLCQSPRLPAFISLLWAKNTLPVRKGSEIFQARDHWKRSHTSPASAAITREAKTSQRKARPRKTSRLEGVTRVSDIRASCHRTHGARSGGQLLPMVYFQIVGPGAGRFCAGSEVKSFMATTEAPPKSQRKK